jgi:hypothetical protein
MTDKKKHMGSIRTASSFVWHKFPCVQRSRKKSQAIGPYSRKKDKHKSFFFREKKISSCSRIWWDPECSKHIRFLVERVP